MDFDLDLMETSIDNEVSSLEQTYENNNKILEAVLIADKLEKQYRMQGYSEAQIQQFHEKWLGLIKDKKENTNKGIIGGAWEWIKKMVAKFVAWCKKIWLTISNLFKNNEKLLEKYEDKLRGKKFTIQVPKYKTSKREIAEIIFGNAMPIILASTGFIVPGNIVSLMGIGKAADNILQHDEFKKSFPSINTSGSVPVEKVVKLVDKKVSYNELKNYAHSLITAEDYTSKSINLAKDAASKSKDPEKVKEYIKYLNQLNKYNMKLLAMSNKSIRQAIYNALSSNESVEILEQQLIDIQYTCESLIDENNKTIMPLIEQTEFIS